MVTSWHWAGESDLPIIHLSPVLTYTSILVRFCRFCGQVSKFSWRNRVVLTPVCNKSVKAYEFPTTHSYSKYQCQSWRTELSIHQAAPDKNRLLPHWPVQWSRHHLSRDSAQQGQYRDKYNFFCFFTGFHIYRYKHKVMFRQPYHL